MSYKETIEQEFYYFSDKEMDFIEKKLKKWGYSYYSNTVCGDCCGMYAKHIFVNGIYGRWKPEHQKEMIKLLKKNGIEASVDVDHKYTDGSGFHYANVISANPNEYEHKN